MRPSTDPVELATFECTECGSRAHSPAARRCPDCGGVLLNLGVERDW